MPPRFSKPCTKCGALTKNPRGFCPDCQAIADKAKEADETRKEKKKHLYGGDYKAKAKKARTFFQGCYLCGVAFKPGDDIQVDHLYPEAGHLSPLLPTHATCNRAKSNKPFNQL